MTQPTDAAEALAQAALRPRSVSRDGNSVTQHSLAELAEQADREAATTAATKPHFGLRFSKLVPPGANR